MKGKLFKSLIDFPGKFFVPRKLASLPTQPSKAFCAFQEFEEKINKTESKMSRPDYVHNKSIHPPYYIFTQDLQPDLFSHTQKKLIL